MGTIKMLAGRTLLKPLNVIKVTKKVSELDDEKNASLKPGEVKQTKLVKRKVIANFQLAEVISVSDVQKTYVVGDIVVFRPGSDIDLDLIKGTIIVNDFNIIGIWMEVDSIEE